MTKIDASPTEGSRSASPKGEGALDMAVYMRRKMTRIAHRTKDASIIERKMDSSTRGCNVYFPYHHGEASDGIALNVNVSCIMKHDQFVLKDARRHLSFTQNHPYTTTLLRLGE